MQRRRPHLLGTCRLLPLLALLWAGIARGEESSLRTLSMKGAFVVNFIHFIDWEDQAVPHPLEIVLVGRGAPLETIAGVLEAQSGEGSRFRVRQTASLEAVDSADLVYCLASEEPIAAAQLERLSAAGIVTVGDTEGFIENGGTIQFVLTQNRLRFRINRSHSRLEGRFQISSKLLNLAVP